jgi:hypothetical protein
MTMSKLKVTAAPFVSKSSKENHLSFAHGSTCFASGNDEKNWKYNLEVYKTELCRSWTMKKQCSYGNKCHYAHGVEDLRERKRIPTFRIQPCIDTVSGTGNVPCSYGNRCNYAHPGQTLRAIVSRTYLDSEYEKLLKASGIDLDSFGVFV